MANVYLVAGQTDIDQNATWSDARYNAGSAGKPATTDNVFILDGDASLVGDIDTDTANITIAGNFSGNIGTSGNPTIIGCDGDVLIESPTVRNIFLAASTTHDVANLIINAPNANVVLSTASGGDFTNVIVKRCASIDPQGKVLNLTYIGGNMPEIPYSATAIATFFHAGPGTVECSRTVTALTGGDGMFKCVETSSGTPTSTTVNAHGRFVYNHQSSGTITTFNQFDRSVFTPAGSSVDFTVTTANKRGIPGQAKFVTKAGPITVTVTNNNDYTGVGDDTNSMLDAISGP